MSYLQSALSSIDPLVIVFLIGSLAMIYGIVHVLMHPLDLESREEEEEVGSPDPERRTAGSRPRRAA